MFSDTASFEALTPAAWVTLNQAYLEDHFILEALLGMLISDNVYMYIIVISMM